MKRNLFEVQTGKKGAGKAKTLLTEAVRVATLSLMALMALWVGVAPVAAQTDALHVTLGGDVGIGTDAPLFDLDIVRAGRVVLQLKDTGGEAWAFVMNSTGAREGLSLTRVGSGIREFRVDNLGNFFIQGDLMTGNGGLCDPGPCDGTFTFYPLESIEEHATYMWENAHLWGVGPTPEGEPINLTRKTTGLLHELEKAHIYIEQLNNSLKASEAENAGLRERLTRVENVLGLAGH